MSTNYSDRLPWQNDTSNLARAIATADGPLSNLMLSNPTNAGLAYPTEDIHAALDVDPCCYQPNPQGLLSARAAISDYYANRGKRVCVDDLFVCCSTSEAYSWLFKLLASPRDSILAPEPSYPLFDDLVQLEGLRLRRYQSHYAKTRWQIDFESVDEALIPSVRALLLVNPNNPTGTCISRSEQTKLSTLGVPLIVDEVFLDYADISSTFAGRHDCLTFILSGLSKVCGLPNLKLGWILVQGPEEERREAKTRLAWIADTYLSTASTVQQALPDLLVAGRSVQDEIRNRCAANRQFLVESCLDVLASDGGWYAIIQLGSEQTDEEWALHLLERHQLIVHPGYFYDIPMESCIVVSLLADAASFQRLVAVFS